MKPRRRALAFALAASLVPGTLIAAQARARRIGILAVSGREDALGWKGDLERALRELGWSPGSLEFVVALPLPGDDPFDAAAEDLVRAKVDVLVTDGTPPTLALKRVAGNTPIVTSLFDPVIVGLARSLALPGGNVTGLANPPGDELYPKPVELLREVAPGLARVGLFHEASYHLPAGQIEGWRNACERQGLRFINVAARGLEDFKAALAQLAPPHRGGAVVLGIGEDLQAILRLAIASRVPTIGVYQNIARLGALLAYSLEYPDEMARRAAVVDKVLRGADPARIAFELPTRTRLLVNLATARALGIVVPKAILLRADEVIE